MEGEKAFLCCGKSGCPSVEADGEGIIVIKDDYGNSVKMKKDEADLLHLAVGCVLQSDGTPTTVESVETKPENFGILPKE